MSQSLESRDVAGVVLDIEGTTTPLSFVYDVLFPYARERVGVYIASNIENSDFSETRQLLREEWSADRRRGEPVPDWPEATTAAASASTRYSLWLMDRDRKSTALKTIQGRIWEAGFRDGTLRGELFEDVPRALSRWRSAGVSISIYSSGSALAQRLLFGHSVAGDLTPCIARYFDTTVGAKREASSYTRIASAIGHAPGRLLFISDVPEELDAAVTAGFQTTLCVRGAEPHESNKHNIIRSFDEVT